MPETTGDERKVMFQPYSSVLNPGFWQHLTNLKLNTLKLSKDPVDIHGSYSCNLSDKLPCLASFDHNSFSEPIEPNNRASCLLYGQVTCTNIVQEFVECDKKSLLDCQGTQIWNAICNGQALVDPEKHLSRFALLVHGDLKNYKFLYWFAFPAINYPKDITQALECQNLSGDCDQSSQSLVQRPILDVFSEEAVKTLQHEYDQSRPQRKISRAYFIIRHFKELSSGSDGIRVYPLTEYSNAIAPIEGQTDATVYFAFSDPSASTSYPGWPLRNFLSLIAVQFKLENVNILRVRRGQPALPSKLEFQYSSIFKVTYQLNSSYIPAQQVSETPPITGWEKNESKQMAPRRVNLSGLLDPKRLAEDAVNLNLKLMKWRLLPDLNLEKISETRCLLLGCGTLGCHIARGLLAWGVKNISLVDNAKISYSNPVRQTLYTFEDCQKSVFKAEAAAASLRKIHPSVNVQAHILSIPMPGHHVDKGEVEQVKKDVSSLENLIRNHDAVFLLMDTRESRWLPSVIAISERKLVVNAAIGFDTFLLQRYGIRDPDQSSAEPKPLVSSPAKGESRGVNAPSMVDSGRLGCYFCNDVVAPGDSTLDRTLDQQCTVSRPGISMMVSAMAVELLASVVSSRMGALTPAPIPVQRGLEMTSDEEYGSELGIVPHTIRGDLSRYHIYMPTSESFNKCAACSQVVIDAYKTGGFEFLQHVFDDPHYLEELTGLKDLQNNHDDVWALSSDEEVCDSEEMNAS